MRSQFRTKHINVCWSRILWDDVSDVIMLISR